MESKLLKHLLTAPSDELKAKIDNSICQADEDSYADMSLDGYQYMPQYETKSTMLTALLINAIESEQFVTYDVDDNHPSYPSTLYFYNEKPEEEYEFSHVYRVLEFDQYYIMLEKILKEDFHCSQILLVPIDDKLRFALND